MDDMRVWVGCFGCYNAGRLFGVWTDADQAPSDPETWAELVLNLTGERVIDDHEHEELWCFDQEGLAPFIEGECSPVAARELAEALDGLDEYEVETLRVYVEGIGVQSLASPIDWRDVAEEASDHFMGRASSRAAWAEEFAEETGALTPTDDFGRPVKHGISDVILRNIDWDGVAQEWTDGMTVVEHDGEVWLFSS